MARRNDHSKEQLKELILDTAWKILEQKGSEGLTARNIAKEIGYAPGTIYNFYQSMTEVQLHINSRTLDLLYEALTVSDCTNSQRPPIENMKSMASCYIQFARDYRPYWLLLFNLQLTEEQRQLSWLGDKIEKLFVPLETQLKRMFAETTSHIECKRAARTLWASVHGLCHLQETAKLSIVDDQKTSLDLSFYLIDTFIAGLEK